MLDPAGPFATQCDVRGPVTCTDSRWYMKRGKLAKSCQKSYSASGERLMTTLRDMRIVRLRLDGTVAPIAQVTGVSGSEITGPAFSPDGTRLYFSSQRNPGATYEVRGRF